jgi:hypothetical protein
MPMFRFQSPRVCSPKPLSVSVTAKRSDVPREYRGPELIGKSGITLKRPDRDPHTNRRTRAFAPDAASAPSAAYPNVRKLLDNPFNQQQPSEFAAVARASELNNALYQAYLQPWIRMMSSPQLARAAIEQNPLRLSYSILSDKNPMMRAVASLAEQARAERTSPASDNPCLAMQQQVSKTMINALDFYRDVRDQLVEQTFHAIYGSPVMQAACGISSNDSPPRPRPGLSPSIRMAVIDETRRLKRRIAEGGPLEAAARVLVYIGKARRRIEEHTFDALRKLLEAHPEVSPADFKAAVREQWAILAVDERAAIAALPQLLPADAEARRAFLAATRTIAEAAGDLNADAQQRLKEVEQLLETDPHRHSTSEARAQSPLSDPIARSGT